jgi:hypothetical protein
MVPLYRLSGVMSQYDSNLRGRNSQHDDLTVVCFNTFFLQALTIIIWGDLRNLINIGLGMNHIDLICQLPLDAIREGTFYALHYAAEICVMVT